jgi:pSer/pThr/pTyr-binding forkhead associated (FHA) protein
MSLSQELVEAYSQATLSMSLPAGEFKQRLDLVRQTMLELPDIPQRGTHLVMRADGNPKLLPLKEETRVGSDPSNDLALACEFISRSHCRLWHDQPDWLVEDLNSTNGIYLNGKPVKKAFLKDGDILQLGTIQLVFLNAGN